MRIALAGLGSRGDVQPMAALAITLARRGHHVRLIVPQGYEELVAESGVELCAIDYDIRAELLSVEGRRLLHSGRDAIAALRAARVITSRNLSRIWRGVAEHTLGAELLVCEITGAGPMEAVAERRQLRCVHVSLQPRFPTTRFPHPFAPLPPLPLPGWANRLHHQMFDQLLWQAVRGAVNDGRRRIFGLPPWPFFGPFAQFRRAARPMLMAYSRHLLPRPPDWPSNIAVTGFWFLPRSRNMWEPPPDLAQFLRAGAPPVFIGFGSMTLPDPQAMASLVLEAVAGAGCRAVIAAGWGGLRAESLPPYVFPIDEAPHEWLFPRMAAIVHHGGAGTTAAALRAGVPSVVVPFMGDQFFWADRLAITGSATAALPRTQLTAAALSQAIAAALENPALRQRAAELAALVAKEPGVEQAAATVEAIAAA